MTTDHTLKADVLAELDWEPSVNADHIGVTTADGVVTLTGHVDSYWQKSAAEHAASRVKGVRAIAEEIEVRLPFKTKHSDADIAAAALHWLTWSVAIPKDAVKVKVEQGFVTLTGEVAWHYQQEEVAQALRRLSGVTGVANHVTVTAHPDTARIKGDIGRALHRSWLSSDFVDVTATGGKVHLTGTVDSWQDRNMASTTAWRAEGTTSVVNDIHVS